MFGLLVFFFKLFFSTFFSILFLYFIIEEEKNNLGVMLFGLLGVMLSTIATYYPVENNGGAVSILVFSILYLAYNFFNISNNNEKLLFIFPGIVGFMVGFGFIFESALVLCFLYLAKNNLNYIYESQIKSDNLKENEENNK